MENKHIRIPCEKYRVLHYRSNCLIQATYLEAKIVVQNFHGHDNHIETAIAT